jgi:hypothetical protein
VARRTILAEARGFSALKARHRTSPSPAAVTAGLCFSQAVISATAATNHKRQIQVTGTRDRIFSYVAPELSIARPTPSRPLLSKNLAPACTLTAAGAFSLLADKSRICTSRRRHNRA